MREKYFQQQQQEQYYEQEDIDPFDLFEMFFTQGMGGNIQFQQRRFRRRHQHAEHEQVNRQPQRINKYMMLVQMLPFLILVLFSVVPYLFQTVIKFYLLFVETLLSIF
jgi:hypothetical protein